MKTKRSNEVRAVLDPTAAFDLARALAEYPIFIDAWMAKDATKERARVMLAWLIGKRFPDTKGVSARKASGEFPLEVLDTVILCVGVSREDDPQAVEECEGKLGRLVREIVPRKEAAASFRALAELLEVIPSIENHTSFGVHFVKPDWFSPQRQDGIKAVMLAAFYGLLGGRVIYLPSISELDSCIRGAWKWKGDDKELRVARRELGLSGLPRGKSGRPKKQRGKK